MVVRGGKICCSKDSQLLICLQDAKVRTKVTLYSMVDAKLSFYYTYEGYYLTDIYVKLLDSSKG